MKLLIPVAVHLSAPLALSIFIICKNLYHSTRYNAEHFFAPAAYFAQRKIKRQTADMQLKAEN